MSKDLECPYCEEWNEVPDECYGEDTNHECTCESCDKVFMFNLSYMPCYSSYPTPCLNEGGSHDWKPIHGFPKEIFVNQRRCSYCGAESTVDRIAEGKDY